MTEQLRINVYLLYKYWIDSFYIYAFLGMHHYTLSKLYYVFACFLIWQEKLIVPQLLRVMYTRYLFKLVLQNLVFENYFYINNLCQCNILDKLPNFVYFTELSEKNQLARVVISVIFLSFLIMILNTFEIGKNDENKTVAWCIEDGKSTGTYFDVCTRDSPIRYLSNISSSVF